MTEFDLNFFPTPVCIINSNLEILDENQKFRELLKNHTPISELKNIITEESLIDFKNDLVSNKIGNSNEYELYLQINTVIKFPILILYQTIKKNRFLIQFVDLTLLKKKYQKLKENISRLDREYKLLKEELRKSNEIIDSTKNELEKRMTRTSRLILNFSHELNTPLNAVIGYSDMILSSYKEKISKKIFSYIKNIKISGKELSKKINNLIEFSNIEKEALDITVKPIFVNDIFEGILDIVSKKMQQKNIKLKENIPDNLAIQSDAKVFGKILLTLINDMIYQTAEGSELIFNVKVDLTTKTATFVIQSEFTEKIYSAKLSSDKFNYNYLKTSETGVGIDLSFSEEILNLCNAKLEYKINKGNILVLKITAVI